MTTIETGISIDGLFCGSVQARWPGKAPSAIQKNVVDGPQTITPTGFFNDAQADLTVHGGQDKAIHHYAADHYPTWKDEGQMDADTVPAAFGENISTIGLTEKAVCIGDTLRLGTAIVQVSQGRQPCWKLNAHTGRPTMAPLFQKTGRTGWYYRVLETGSVSVGDSITLLERPNPDWTVQTVTMARLTYQIDTAGARTLSVLPELAGGWRDAFAKMAEGKAKEDTSARLKG